MEARNFEQFMTAFTFEPVETGGVKILQNGEPLYWIEDGDYISSEGEYHGKNIHHDAIAPSEELARNFLKLYFIGLASTNEIDTWKHVNVFDEELVW